MSGDRTVWLTVGFATKAHVSYALTLARQAGLEVTGSMRVESDVVVVDLCVDPDEAGRLRTLLSAAHGLEMGDARAAGPADSSPCEG